SWGPHVSGHSHIVRESSAAAWVILTLPSRRACAFLTEGIAGRSGQLEAPKRATCSSCAAGIVGRSGVLVAPKRATWSSCAVGIDGGGGQLEATKTSGMLILYGGHRRGRRADGGNDARGHDQLVRRSWTA